MAKRGERRPYRLTYRWDGDGVGGTTAFISTDQRDLQAAKMRERAEHLGRTIEITFTERTDS